MKLSPLRAAELCAATYRPRDTGVTFLDFDDGADDGVCYGVTVEPDCLAVTFRGSASPQDWFIDLMADPVRDARFGPVHHGFLHGMDRVWGELKAKLGEQVADLVICGHSLGAARGAILNAIMLAEFCAPAARYGFGEPRPGFQQLAFAIAPTPARVFCNGDDDGHDMVTEVPYTMAPLFDYRPSVPAFEPCRGGRAGPALDYFRYHHVDLYVAAMKAAGT